MPGDTPLAAALDLARTVCRRAERRVCALDAGQQLRNPEIIVYLNRLADVLWLMARGASVPAPGDQADAGLASGTAMSDKNPANTGPV
jgi:cob(I)alamin adenosyltransferase